MDLGDHFLKYARKKFGFYIDRWLMAIFENRNVQPVRDSRPPPRDPL